MHRETGLLAHGPESVPLEPPQFEADTRESHASVVDLMASYLEGGHPFPDRAHLSVLFATAQLAMFRSMERWIEFARHEVAEWPTTKGLGITERTEELVRMMADDEPVFDVQEALTVSRNADQFP